MSENTNQNPEQELFTIEDIISASFDFSSYSDEERASLIEETSSMIMEASLLRSLTDAPEDIQDAFQNMIESEPSEEEMGDFINKNFPKFQETVIEELDIFLNSEDADDVAPKTEEEE